MLPWQIQRELDIRVTEQEPRAVIYINDTKIGDPYELKGPSSDTTQNSCCYVLGDRLPPKSPL